MRISVSFIKWLSQYIDLTENKKSILCYGLDIIFSSLIGYACIIGLSCLLGTQYIVIPMLIIHSLLRSFSGGAHGKKLVYCISLSVIVFNTMGLILKYILNLQILTSKEMLIIDFIIFLLGLYFITKKVPVDVKEKPITSQQHRKQLKKYSYAVLLVWYSIVFFTTTITHTKYQTFIMSISVGILWQIFTLTHLGEKFVECYGRVLNKIGI